MELRTRDRVVQLKVVYYGPAVCGKTTNLQMLHAAAIERHRGELITVNSQQERTILFDLLPLRGVGFHGFDIRFQLVAVPGQAPYGATRRLVMRGTDAVVFVANSAADRLDENVASLAEMKENLKANAIDPEALPIVFQYNKRDLPEVSSVEELTLVLNPRREPVLEAVAVRGEGVIETLGTMMARTMADLTKRYRSLALHPDETVQTWAWGAIQQVFGRATLAGTGVVPATREGEDLRRVQVPVPKIPRGATGPELDRALVGSYVETSMSLGDALDAMRQERDEARRRVKELELTVQAIEELGDGKAPAETLSAALGHLVAAAGCSRGTLIAPGADQKLRVIAAVGMKKDPFVTRPAGVRIVRQRFVPLKHAALLDPEQLPELPGFLEALEPAAAGLAVVPIRSGFGLHGLALFYLGASDPLPGPTVLDHVSLMARALGAWFVVRRGQTLVEASAHATRTALPEIERVVRLVGELLRAAAREPQRARTHLEKAARTLDSIALLTSGLSATDTAFQKR